jgi:dTMP kinase
MRGKFIVIDGMDHAGKGAQLTLLQQKLSKIGSRKTYGSISFTREPGGTPLAEELRDMLLSADKPSKHYA